MTHSQLVNHARRAAREVEFDGGGAFEIVVDPDDNTEEVIVEVRRSLFAFGIEIVLSVNKIVLSVNKPETEVLMSQCDGETFGAFVSFLDCMKVLEAK